MRPVAKGDAPGVFSEYKEALPHLRERLGTYCSYCERRIRHQLAVEHVQPKKYREDLALEWGNFLLACANCNSTKGSQDLYLDDYYWPDVDNTARAFTYREGGIVQANAALSDGEKDRAQRTLALTGLNRLPGHPRLRPGDKRWLDRREAWGRARRARRRIEAEDTPSMREQAAETAAADGFWSVWMTVFADDVDMKHRLCEAFPGTASDCFDEDLNAILRPGGAL